MGELLRRSTRHPGLICGAWASWILAAMPGLLVLTVDTSTDSVLDRHSEEWSFYSQSRSIFGGDEIIVAATSSHAPFDSAALQAHARISDEFEALDGAGRVDSLTTFPVVRSSPSGGLRLDPAFRSDEAHLESAARGARDALTIDRILPGTILSDDGRTLAVVTTLPAESSRNHEELVAHMSSIVPNGTLLSGVPIFRFVTNRQTSSEVVRFSILTIGCMAFLLFAMFGGVREICLGMLPGAVGAVTALAAMGYSGTPVSISSMIVPSMLLALGTAYAMHVLVASRNLNAQVDAVARLEPVALPLLLSGTTTAIGLAAMFVVGIDAIRHVSVFGSLGVATTAVASVTLVPAIVLLWPSSQRARNPLLSWIERSASMIAVGVVARSRLILIVWGMIFLALSLGLSCLTVETDATTWLASDHPVRRDYEEIRESLSGISPVNVVISSSAGVSVLHPTVLSAVDELATYLSAQREVGKVISIADPLRQIHGGFAADGRQSLPGTEALAEQYMLLLDGIEMIDSVITPDREHANLILRLNDNGSTDILSLARRAEEWWGQHGVAGVSSRVTGIMFEFARAEDEIAWGQLSGLLVGVLAVCVVLFAVFRNFELALIAVVPNIVPLAMVFGAMGLFSIPVDAGTVFVGGLALGVAVDDTMHLLVRFAAHSRSGQNAESALGRALRESLPAILLSTIAVTVGFSLFAASEFTLTRNLGWLVGAVMIVCVIADVSLLGAVLAHRRHWFSSHSAAREASVRVVEGASSGTPH